MNVPQQYGDLGELARALARANATLQADKAQLERQNAKLSDSSERLEQTIKTLHVIVAVLLAITGGLTVGLATSMAGVAPQAALGSATGVFFAVIMTSIAVLSYIRR